MTTEWYPFVKFLARGGHLFFYYIHDKITAIRLVKRSAMIFVMAGGGGAGNQNNKIQYGGEI